MDIDAWRERQINKRTQRYIEDRNRAFQKAHAEDTDEELREYVRRQAMARKTMPHPLELPGGLYLRRRLGDWDQLALELGMPPVGTNRARQAYHRLREKGEELFTAERRAIKTSKNQNKPLEEILPQPVFTDEG